jgi:hypothetical protein
MMKELLGWRVRHARRRLLMAFDLWRRATVNAPASANAYKFVRSRKRHDFNAKLSAEFLCSPFIEHEMRHSW